MPPNKILVVEDDLHTRSIIEMVLTRDRTFRREPLQVLTAADGQEGLELFRKESPELLITDLLMPKMDGFELIKAVRAEKGGETVPILATSAIVKDKVTLGGLERDYSVQLLLKPFSPRELAQRVQRMIHGEDSTQRVPLAARKRSNKPRRPVGARTPGSAPPREAAPREQRPDPAPEGMTGDVAQTSIAALFLEAIEAQWSGVLDLRRDKVRKRVYLQSGNPLFVQSNLRGETLGQLLVSRGGLTEEQHQRTLLAVQQQGLKYGEALVRLELMTERQVMAELVAQTRLKVERCLRWRTGTWRFEEDLLAGGKVPHCTIDPIQSVFAGLRGYPNVEEALARFVGDDHGQHRLVPQPRMEWYRDNFVAVFGPDLLQKIGEGCPLLALLPGAAVQDVAVQVDALLQTGLVKLELGEGESLVDKTTGAGGDARAAAMSLSNLYAPATQTPNRSSRSEPGVRAVSLTDRQVLARAAKPQVESAEVRTAKQLIDATYLGLHGRNHYQVLGVIPDTDSAGIEVAYQIKRRQFDLERYRSMDLGDAYARLEEICATLDAAFAVLSDDTSRAQYRDTIVGEMETARERALQAEELYRRGCAFLREDNPGLALDALEQAIGLDEQAEYQAQAAFAYFLFHGQSAEAAVESMVRVQAALAADPEQPGPHVVAAKISRAMGAVEEAVEHLRDAIKLDPAAKQAFDQLEELLLEGQQLDELEREYRRAIFLLGNADRKWAAALWKRLARLYAEQLGDESRAEMAAQAALKLDPDDGPLRAALAEAAGRDPERWQEAALGYRTLLQREPSDGSPLAALFCLHRDAGRTDAAFIAASAAMLRGVAESDQLSFVDRHRPPDASLPKVTLDPETRQRLTHPNEEQQLSALLLRLAPLIDGRHPLQEEDAQLGGARVESEELPEQFRMALNHVSGQLGMAVPGVVVKAELGNAVEPAATAGPTLLVGVDALGMVDQRELCFRLATGMSCLSGARKMACSHGVELLRDYVVATVGLATNPQDVDQSPPPIREIQKAIMADESMRVDCINCVQILRAKRDREHVDPEQWCRGVRFTAERVGLLLCTDLIVAGKVAGERDETAQLQLIHFALGEAYSQMRERFGMHIGS